MCCQPGNVMQSLVGKGPQGQPTGQGFVLRAQEPVLSSPPSLRIEFLSTRLVSTRLHPLFHTLLASSILSREILE